MTCIKLLFCRLCAHFPCIPWLCKLCAHWAHWVWCHGFQREAWLFSQSHFLHVFCGLLHYLILNHVLYSFVNNLIIQIYFDTVSFCPSYQFLFPSAISQLSWWIHWRKLCFSIGLLFSQKNQASTNIFCHMFYENWKIDSLFSQCFQITASIVQIENQQGSHKLSQFKVITLLNIMYTCGHSGKLLRLCFQTYLLVLYDIWKHSFDLTTVLHWCWL